MKVQMLQGLGENIPNIFYQFGLEKTGGFRSRDSNFHAQAMNYSTYTLEVDLVLLLPFVDLFSHPADAEVASVTTIYAVSSKGRFIGCWGQEFARDDILRILKGQAHLKVSARGTSELAILPCGFPQETWHHREVFEQTRAEYEGITARIKIGEQEIIVRDGRYTIVGSGQEIPESDIFPL